MHRRFAVLAAGALCLACGSALAAPPTPAQVERRRQVRDAEYVGDQLIPAIESQYEALVDQMLVNAKASAEDRSRLRQVMARQSDEMRDMLAWSKLKPIYVRVYTQTMTDREVAAMTAFYESPEGRSVMQKMPQVMQRAMVEMQPLIQSTVQRSMAAMKAELDKRPAGSAKP